MIWEPAVIQSQASLEKEDIDKFIRLIKPYEPKVVVEIGMWRGFSAEVWIKAFNPELLITLEQDHKHEDGVYYESENHIYLWDVDSATEDTRNQVQKLLGERQIDFLFLDGGHEFKTILQDWKLYSELVKEGGIIAFHDILHISEHCQVKLLWEYLKRQYDYVEINCGEGSTGFGVIFNTKRLKKVTYDKEL